MQKNQYPFMNETKILLVDDEPDILEFMTYNLEKEGYTVLTATNGTDAINFAKEFNPQIIILDIMMPKPDGIETCQLLRQNKEFEKTFIAFLTARAEDWTQVVALESGADDFVTKPIMPRLLVSKIKSWLRRPEIQNLNDAVISINTIKIRDLEINPHTFIVKKNQKSIELPRKEFNLLLLLASQPNIVLSRQTILDTVWGTAVIVTERTIDVHIRRIREKLGGNYIKTLKGVGYKFID